VYFRSGILESLEQKRLSIMGLFATRISANVRMYLTKSEFDIMKDAAITLQSVGRMIISRGSFLDMKER